MLPCKASICQGLFVRALFLKFSCRKKYAVMLYWACKILKYFTSFDWPVLLIQWCDCFYVTSYTTFCLAIFSRWLFLYLYCACSSSSQRFVFSIYSRNMLCSCNLWVAKIWRLWYWVSLQSYGTVDTFWCCLFFTSNFSKLSAYRLVE